MVVIYVLRLERGKFYVGMTRRNIQRIWEHIDGEGAKWTKKYPPLEGREVVFMKDGLHKIDEDRITIEQMREHGYHNVRGGQWCHIKLNETQIKTIKTKIKELPKQKSKSRPDIGQYYRSKAMNRNNQKNKIPTKGYCIRCSERKKYDFDKPMCLECYREWQYDDDEYYEEYCHRCGKSNDTTLEKPLCLKCYRIS